MIEVKNVSKEFLVRRRISLFKKEKTIKKASDNISLKLERGQIIGVLGENGAGKTTLIKMMTTLLIPDKGEILLDGINVNHSLKETRQKINMISGGERNLYWRLSAMENLLYFGSLYGLSKKKLLSKAEHLLKDIGLWEERNTPVEQFSKGMKQRLQIVKGLINDPDYLFLDEPTLGLDVEISLELRRRIKEIARTKKTGILLTTHYMAEAEELCDYIYIIDNGSIILSGNKEEVFEALSLEKEIVVYLTKQYVAFPENELRKSFPNLKKEVRADGTIIKIQSKNPNLQETIKIFTSLKIEISEIKVDNPTLEKALITAKKRNRDVKI